MQTRLSFSIHSPGNEPASTDILSNNGAYGARSMPARIVLAAVVFVLMMLKGLRSWVWNLELAWARIRRPTAK